MGGAQWIKCVKNLGKYFPQVCLCFIHIEVLRLEISKLKAACLLSALFISLLFFFFFFYCMLAISQESK